MNLPTQNPPTANPPLDNPERFDRSQIPDDAEGLALFVFTVLASGPAAALASEKIPLAFSKGIVDGLVEALDSLIAATADSEDDATKTAHDACVVIRKMFDTDQGGGGGGGEQCAA